MTNNDSEIKLVIELIKKNDKNTEDKFEYISSRLSEHIISNKEQFDEIKDLIRDDIEANEKVLNNTIRPIQELLKKHEEDISIIKAEKSSFVKEAVCRINEAKIQEFFSSVTRKLIIYNLAFLIIYVILLYNSNIAINWPDFFGIIAGIKKIFF